MDNCCWMMFGLVTLWQCAVMDAQMPTPSPTAPTSEPTDPIQSQLSLIIGLPVGIGLALIGVGACLIWLTCSAYCENKQNPKTHSTNMHMSNLSASAPVRSFNSSSAGTDSRAFQPEPTVSTIEKHSNKEPLSIEEPDVPPQGQQNVSTGGSMFDVTYQQPPATQGTEFNVIVHTN